MRKLIIKKRLDSWAKCEHKLDHGCGQCEYYNRFGDDDGVCDLDNHPVCDDDDCTDNCDNCYSNNRCVIQDQVDRSVKDINFLIPAFDEYNDILLFQSLLTKKILKLVSRYCLHFERKISNEST